MRSPLQQALLSSLASILKPIVKLMLQAGVGSSEFSTVAKSVFVQVASAEYGFRGRPTNISRVSAMTGISRKEVSRIKTETQIGRWNPDMETSPANSVIHFWHFDPEFSESPGKPRPLPVDGTRSFTTLVKRYAGDIPVGAMRAELCRAGTVSEEPDGLLHARDRYFYSTRFDEDFIRGVAFALANLGTTVVHNAGLHNTTGERTSANRESARFERYAWTEHFSEDAILAFRTWLSREGERFLERADDWMGKNEAPREQWTASRKAVGVGVYYFEEDESPK
jgi:uncharacterized protein DUF6502